MEWKKSNEELPSLNKSTRCIAFVEEKKSPDLIWNGYVDVFFNPHEGWKRCETETSVHVLKWITIEEFEND